MAKLAKALAPLCAAILGALIYVRWVRPWVVIVTVVLGVAALPLAKFLLAKEPVIAAIVISMWILTGIGLMALATAFLLWITLRLPQLFPNLPAETLKEVCAVITGALTTFVGVVVTKDMEEGGGFFWPGWQFRGFVKNVFSTDPNKIVDNGVDPYGSAFEDRVHSGPEGWGLTARMKRAIALRAWLAGRANPQAPPPAK